MSPNISVGRRILTSAFFAICLGPLVTQTFAQTVTQHGAQDDKAGTSLVYVPPTGGERLKWAVDGTFAASSIATGVFLASWNTHPSGARADRGSASGSARAKLRSPPRGGARNQP
jgi:hypothetical protein